MHKIKYTSYRQGAIIEVEIEDSTWEQLEKDYHEAEAFVRDMASIHSNSMFVLY